MTKGPVFFRFLPGCLNLPNLEVVEEGVGEEGAGGSNTLGVFAQLTIPHLLLLPKADFPSHSPPFQYWFQFLDDPQVRSVIKLFIS